MCYMNLNKLCLNQSNTEVEERIHVVTLTRTVGRRHSVVTHTSISFFQCCFTSTETIRPIRDGEPRTPASTFTQLLNSDVQCCRNQSTETTRLIRDGRLDFHTAPKLRASVPTRGLQVHGVPQVPQRKSVKVEDREADDLFSDQLELTCGGPASLPGPTDALTARLRITEQEQLGPRVNQEQSGPWVNQEQSGPRVNQEQFGPRVNQEQLSLIHI